MKRRSGNEPSCREIRAPQRRRLSLAVPLLLAGLLASGCNRTRNPMKITELHSPDSPLITFRIILRAGSINDTKGKEGLNALTAMMIAEGGTTSLPYAEIIAKMYPWAAGFSAQGDKEVTTFVGTVHRDHLAPYYELMRDLLLHPRFDPADFARNKDQLLNFLQKDLRGTDDESLGKEALNISLYSGHPYGTPGATVQGVQAITLEDVKQYYQKTYSTGALWVGLAGGYPQTLVEQIRKDFRALPDAPASSVSLPNAGPIDRMEILFVKKPAGAVAISLGHPIPLTRKDKDYYPLMVANSYLGEHRTFAGLLMNRLREDRGLNYGDYSYIERFTGGLGSGNQFANPNTPLRQQIFSVWLRPVEPKNAHFALRATMYYLRRFADKGLTQDEFEHTRKFLLNYSKLWAQTLDRRLGYMLDSEFYGTEYYLDRLDKELRAMTLDQVNQAIRKYIDPRNMKVAIVSDDDKLSQAIVENRPSPITYASPVAQRILDEDKEISVLPLDINKEKSRTVSVESMFDK